MCPIKNEILLIGAGGHCRSCIDVIEQEGRFEIAGIVDKAEDAGSGRRGEESGERKAERGKRKEESGKRKLLMCWGILLSARMMICLS